MIGLWIFALVLLIISMTVVAGVRYITESAAMTAIGAVLCILIVGGLVWYNWAATYRNDHWATCTVTGKDRGGTDGSYRIYTDECGVLANSDSFLRGKFNSADVWQEIPEKGVIRVRIAGSRWHFVSQMPNVFEVGDVN